MSLFRNKKCKHIVLAPQTGKIIPITEVPDKVFSGKVLGDGVGIVPVGNKVVAPVDGTVVQVAETLHAVCMQGDDGAEIIIHLGIDTVELKGKGFTCHVESGQHVSAGDLLMDMDISFIKSAGYNVITPCIITNMDKIKNISMKSGNAEAGITTVIEYNI